MHGEILELTDPIATLATLGEYEDCPSEYRRERVIVNGRDEAHVYVYNRSTSDLEPIPSGRFSSPRDLYQSLVTDGN